MTPNQRRLSGVLLLILSAFMIYHSIEILQGKGSYPQECHGRKAICELTNFLFEQGGFFAVGIVNLATSLFLFVVSYIMITMPVKPDVDGGYGNQPISLFIQGPLIHTPQGVVVLGFSSIYLLLAFAFAFLGMPPPFGWHTMNIVALCLVWPFFLLLMFIKHGLPTLTSSIKETCWLVLYALAPVIFYFWQNHTPHI